MTTPLPPSNGKTFLITGINGYIASVLGLHILTKGYSLHGTARRLKSTEEALLNSKDGPYAAYRDRVRIFEVPDMTIEGAFDEAIQGVTGIFHTASPINFNLQTYSETVIPAQKGCEVLLSSALRQQQQLEQKVKTASGSSPDSQQLKITSVVITSSVITIIEPQRPIDGHVYTELDFAATSLEKAKKNHDEGTTATPPNILYGASKTAAEKAAWKFKEEFKPSFAITTINPTVVIGPPILLPQSSTLLNETLKPFFALLSGGVDSTNSSSSSSNSHSISKTIPQNIGSGSWVDVRDVALIHHWAMENPEKADGQRYIACAGFGPLQAAADILREEDTAQNSWRDINKNIDIPRGVPGEGYIGFEGGKVVSVMYPKGVNSISGAKAEREVGFVYRSFRECVLDTAEALKALL